MSTARLFVEALDTLRSLGWALRVWIVLMAVTVTLALYTVVVTVAFACRTLWRGVAAVLAALQRSSVPEAPPEPQKPAQGRTRPTPAWAQSEPHDYHNAA